MINRYKFMKKWSEFILNETLKTNDIDFVVENTETDLRLSGIDCDVIKNHNKIELHIYDFYKLDIVDKMFDYINSLFIDRNGWFPSSMKLLNDKNKINTLKYDQEYLYEYKTKLKTVVIIYEAKYDQEYILPNKLYHMSIQQYKNNILKNGLIPKSKNKKTIHLDRIYFCDNPTDCYKLIPDMKYDYIKRKNKNKLDDIDIKWIIYEIDSNKLNINLYKDPNFINKGYYAVDNIPPEHIKIYDSE